MNFLPTDYEAPKTNSKYMKFEDGSNKFRILSSPIIGWEDWENKKPIRFKLNFKPEKPVDPEKPIRHFWAFIVWNYSSQRIEILEITQATIRKKIEALSKDSDWGSPYNYDIKVSKSGQRVDTEYEVNPSPKTPIDPKIKDAFIALPIDLDEMFKGGDPFAAAPLYRTKAFWEKDEVMGEPIIQDDLITKAQQTDIERSIDTYIHPHAPSWKEAAFKAFKITNFSQLKKQHYDLVMKRIEEKKQQIKTDDEVPF